MDIPIVKSTNDFVVSKYNVVKKSNGLIGGVLEKAEGAVQFADDTFVKPVANVVQRPVNAISNAADRQLEYFQKLFPPINYTPQQMKKVYHELTLKDIFVFLLSLPMLAFAVAYGWTIEVISIIRDAFVAALDYCVDTLYAILPNKLLDWIANVLQMIVWFTYWCAAIVLATILYVLELIAGTVSKVFHWITGTASVEQ